MSNEMLDAGILELEIECGEGKKLLKALYIKALKHGVPLTVDFREMVVDYLELELESDLEAPAPKPDQCDLCKGTTNHKAYCHRILGEPPLKE